MSVPVASPALAGSDVRAKAPAPPARESALLTQQPAPFFAAPQSTGGSGLADMSRAPLIVLLFDLRTSSPEVRQRAVAIASRNADADYLRSSVGLGWPHVWRVATVGWSVETVQDFTWDNDKLQAALAKVAAAPAASASGARNVGAIRTMCDELARLQSGEKYFENSPEIAARLRVGALDASRLGLDAKGVTYFTAGTPLTTEEATGIENACRRPNVAYAAVTIPGPPRAPAVPDTTHNRLGPTYSFDTSQTPNGRRLINLVFEPGLLPGTDLQTAVDWAMQYVDQKLTDLVAVSILGLTPRTLQDFTADPDKLRAAIRTVGTLPRDPVGVEVKLRAMQSQCLAMSRRAEDSLQRVEIGTLAPADRVRVAAVWYFGTGVARGLLAPIDMRPLVSPCTIAGVQFYDMSGAIIGGAQMTGARSLSVQMEIERARVLSMAAPVSAPFTGITLGVVDHQAGSPVTLSPSKAVLDSGYASVVIRNSSAKPIRSVSIGALVRPTDPALATPQIFTARGPVVDLPPGGSVEISARIIDGSAFGILGRDGAAGELGVVEVEFADGSKWTYDLKAKGRFEK